MVIIAFVIVVLLLRLHRLFTSNGAADLPTVVSGSVRFWQPGACYYASGGENPQTFLLWKALFQSPLADPDGSQTGPLPDYRTCH